MYPKIVIFNIARLTDPLKGKKLTFGKYGPKYPNKQEESLQT